MWIFFSILLQRLLTGDVLFFPYKTPNSSYGNFCSFGTTSLANFNNGSSYPHNSCPTDTSTNGLIFSMSIILAIANRKNLWAKKCLTGNGYLFRLLACLLFKYLFSHIIHFWIFWLMTNNKYFYYYLPSCMFTL